MIVLLASLLLGLRTTNTILFHHHQKQIINIPRVFSKVNVKQCPGFQCSEPLALNLIGTDPHPLHLQHPCQKDGYQCGRSARLNNLGVLFGFTKKPIYPILLLLVAMLERDATYHLKFKRSSACLFQKTKFHLKYFSFTCISFEKFTLI